VGSSANPTIDYQDIIYYAAPKQKATLNSLDEVDPILKEPSINLDSS
jgi:hypothetical protein